VKEQNRWMWLQRGSQHDPVPRIYQIQKSQVYCVQRKIQTRKNRRVRESMNVLWGYYSQNLAALGKMCHHSVNQMLVERRIGSFAVVQKELV
jgi:hypothetical protein